MSVEAANASLRCDGIDEYNSQRLNEPCFHLTISDPFGHYTQLSLPARSVQAFADLFHRLLGERPRDVDQAVRVVVEHVAAAPPPTLQRSAQDTEKDDIKLRLMR